MMAVRGYLLLLFLTAWPMVGGALSFIVGRCNKRVRDCLTWGVTLIELGAALLCTKHLGAELSIDGLCALGANMKLDGFRLIYVLITAFMWAAAEVFSSEYLAHHKNRNRYHLFVMTEGAMIGVFLSADLFTTFLFFEMMSMASWIMVIQDETPSAMRAAGTYLVIAILGGLVTLAGLILLHCRMGTLNIDALREACVSLTDRSHLLMPGLLTLFGFAAKAAVFPLHVWLPTAHAVAPAPSSALLSGLLTKTGLFGVLVLSVNVFPADPTWGLILLLPALTTMVLGAVLGLFSVNIKRTLACSSMSQLGFILTGAAMLNFLGAENDLAARGVVLYMIGHSLIKLVLFLAAGVVHMNTGKLNLNDIQGFGRGKPLFLFAFSMGALGLMGVPLWNGYLGKTLLHESIVEYLHLLHHHSSSGVVPAFLAAIGMTEAQFFNIVEWTFLASGGMTVAYMTKLFVVLFVAAPREAALPGRYMNAASAAALTLPACLLPLMGLLPHQLTDPAGILGSAFLRGPDVHHAIHYFSPESLKGAAISLGIGAAIYLFFVRGLLMRREAGGHYRCLDLWPAWLDLERALYRPLLIKLLPFLGRTFAGTLDSVASGLLLLPSRVGRAAALLLDRTVTWPLCLLPFLGAMTARIVDVIPSGPIGALLSRASRQKFVRQPEDETFGLYAEPGEKPSFRTALPSSLAYSLLMFLAGLMIFLAYLLTSGVHP